MHDIFLILQDLPEITGSLSVTLDTISISAATSVDVNGSLSQTLDDITVIADATGSGSAPPVEVIRRGGPALPIRQPKRRKKRLDEVLEGLEPVAAQIEKDAGKLQIQAAAARAVRRAKAQHQFDAFADQIDRILAQRRDYDRDVVLAAIAAQRIMRMEEEEAAALILLAA